MHSFWLKVWERRTQYAGSGSFRAWLLSLARNHCVSHYRKASVRSAGMQALKAEGVHLDLTSTTPVPSDSVMEREARERALSAVARLPERQRRAVELRLLEELTSQEAAELMGCEPATVRSLLRHALVGLRTMMREGCEP